MLELPGGSRLLRCISIPVAHIARQQHRRGTAGQHIRDDLTIREPTCSDESSSGHSGRLSSCEQGGEGSRIWVISTGTHADMAAEMKSGPSLGLRRSDGI